MTTQPQTPPRRARHLMDPDNPRPAPRRSEGMSLEGVQMWVASTLAFTTIMHMAGGLVLAAMYVGDDHLDAQVGLNVIAAAFGVLAVAAARLIHRKPMASWWLVTGVLPGLVGLWLTLR